MARLEGYEFGRVMVGGEEQTRDVIVLPGRVVSNWWRSDGHSLVLDDLDAVSARIEKVDRHADLVRTGGHSSLDSQDVRE